MKTKHFQYLLFNSMLIIGASTLTVSNIIMRTYANYGYLIYIILLPIILLGGIFFKFNHISLKTILNSFILRLLMFVYLVLSSFIYIIAYLKVTNDFFYQLTSPLIILTIILLTSTFFSLYGIQNIINIGFIFFIFCIILLSLTFFNTTQYDFNLIKLNWKLELNFKLIGYCFIYYDSFVLALFSNKKDNNKSHYIIVSLIALLINTFFILQNYLLYDSNYFINGKYPILNSFQAFTNNRYFEHFDLIYLIFISIYLLIRLALNTEFFRITLKLKRNNYLIFLFPLLLIILSYLSSYIKINLNIINYLMITSSIFLFLILFYHYILLRRKLHESRTNKLY